MPEMVDVTDSGSQGCRRSELEGTPGAVLRQAHATPERLRLKIGDLEVEASAPLGSPACLVGGSRILVDGRPFPVKSIVIRGHAHGVWEVELEYYPHSRAHQGKDG